MAINLIPTAIHRIKYTFNFPPSYMYSKWVALLKLIKKKTL